MKNIVLVSSTSGDWEGLYFKEKLFTEGQAITSNDWLQLIEHCHNEFDGTYKAIEIDSDYLEEIGGFPILFQDIELEMLSYA